MIRRFFPIEPAPASDEGPQPGDEHVDLAQDYAWCERVARYSWADYAGLARFFPTGLVPDLWAICAFARGANDIADAPGSEQSRHQALDTWEDRLGRAWHGEAEHPVFRALAHTAEERQLPITPLVDMIAAHRMDIQVHRYPTFGALESYLERAALPPGRLLLCLFGQQDAVRQRYADDFSIALLLTHMLADVRSDLVQGRLYLPLEDLKHFEVTESDLAFSPDAPSVRDLFRFEAARVRSYFCRARPLLSRLEGPLADIAGLLWMKSMSILAQIEGERGSQAALSGAQVAEALGQRS